MSNVKRHLYKDVAIKSLMFLNSILGGAVVNSYEIASISRSCLSLSNLNNIVFYL